MWRMYSYKFVCLFLAKILKIFTGADLQLLTCGESELDFDELRHATTYSNGYSEDDPTIMYFWEVLYELSEEDKRNFLAFTTGSDRAPVGGLGTLNLNIIKNGSVNTYSITNNTNFSLPTAATCSNKLLLPPYTDKATLCSKLLVSIKHYTGFGLL